MNGIRNIRSDRMLRVTRWTLQAGKKAMEVFRSVTPHRKSDDSYVTRADREIESFLREKIGTYEPEARIFGEEESVTGGSGDSWYLDPIDGTAAYATELPIWAVSVGIWEGTEPQSGVLYAPFMDDLYVCDGERSLKNTRPLSELSFGKWTTESLLCVPSDTHRHYHIDFPGKTRCLGSTAYHMAMAVDGRAGAALIGTPHIWDIAAVVALGDILGVTCRGINSGKPPDWERLCEGERPVEPLLFGAEEQVKKLLGRIEMTGSPGQD